MLSACELSLHNEVKFYCSNCIVITKRICLLLLNGKSISHYTNCLCAFAIAIYQDYIATIRIDKHICLEKRVENRLLSELRLAKLSRLNYCFCP